VIVPVSDEADEVLLLDLLNTTPVVDGSVVDQLADVEAGVAWLAARGRPASAGEWRSLLEARSALQGVVRGTAGPASLARFLAGVSYRPAPAGDGLVWHLDLPEGRSVAARAVLAWGMVRASRPGRLRPCANPACERFLLDRSKTNSARWCSMAVCGNRMKARRHHERGRRSPSAEGATE
jgi:predicted RNA-binding Zn ribbon-like protein